MQQQRHHPWELSPKQAIALQRDLADAVEIKPLHSLVRRVAGADLAYHKESNQLVAAVCVLDAESLELIELKTAIEPIGFPYIPGLLSFREAPTIARLLESLQNPPDLLLCDGQGIAHPRRLGIASHLGLLFDLPTIGCAKSRLYGQAEEPGPNRGDWSALINPKGAEIGRVLRSRTNVRPLYISPGHRIDCAQACDWVLKLAPRYRLPETTRITDHRVTELRRQLQQKA